MGVADWKYEKTTQISDFFVKTLIIGDEVQSEVGYLSEIILLFSNAKNCFFSQMTGLVTKFLSVIETTDSIKISIQNLKALLVT
jgi:hypothetical protein